MRLPHVLLLLLLGLLASCAQQVAPKGGPKDVTPPQIVGSEPANYSTRFNRQSIEIEFDEFVQLRNINQALVVSPPLKKQPETRLKGKRLIISFEDTLRANTTYIFNLGNGVQDITEGNPLDSNLFVFSTGDFLDSLTVSGRIRNAFDLTPPEAAWVMLYGNQEDSAPRTLRPAYLGKADKSGNFQVDFVKPGSFKVVALNDLNNNYLFDLEDEQFAFLDSAIVSDSLPKTELLMFTEAPSQHYVTKAKPGSFGKLQVVFNKPTEAPTLRDLSGTLTGDWYLPELLTNGDTLVAWMPNGEGGDTLQLEASTNGTPIDTVDVVTLKRGQKPAGRGKSRAGEFKLTFKNNLRGKNVNPFKPLLLTASHPVKSFNAKRFVLKADSVRQEVSITAQGTVERQLALEHEWQDGKKYRLLVLPGAVEDIFGLKNDSLELNFTASSKDDFGNFTLKVAPPPDAPQYVLQLQDKAGTTIETHIVSEARELRFTNLIPGSYGMKLIYDANSNGKWDTGNYDEKRQPEKVLFYSGTVDIRAGWDVDLDWSFEDKDEERAGRK